MFTRKHLYNISFQRPILFDMNRVFEAHVAGKMRQVAQCGYQKRQSGWVPGKEVATMAGAGAA